MSIADTDYQLEAIKLADKRTSRGALGEVEAGKLY
jgi:hypothetical protein